MASINIKIGDAFLLETPPNVPHLYIAIASTENDKYLFVNLTTRRPNSEIACILLPDTEGMPSYVKAESIIDYRFKYVCELDTNELARRICVGSRIPKCTFPPDILEKIQVGGLISKRLQNMHKDALKKFLDL